MAWDCLEEEIAEEFGGLASSYDRRSDLTYSRRIDTASEARVSRALDAARLRRRRAERWRALVSESRIATRCQRPGCPNTWSATPGQGGKARKRFCSKHCAFPRVGLKPVRCAAPGCTTVVVATARRRVCSNACRQRLWYHEKRRARP